MAVLSALCADVLKPTRVATVQTELKEEWEKRGEPDRRKLLELGAAAGNLEAQLATLYGQVSAGTLEMERSLSEFIAATQRRLEVACQNIAMLKSRQQLQFWKFGEQQLEEFLTLAREALSAPTNPHVRGFLQMLVQDIKVDAGTLRMRGGNARLVSSVSKWKKGTPCRRCPDSYRIDARRRDRTRAKKITSKKWSSTEVLFRRTSLGLQSADTCSVTSSRPSNKSALDDGFF